MADKDTSASPAEITIDQMFLLSDLLPNASEAFLATSPALKDIRDNADIVLDASALLLPYGSGSQSLKSIASLFEKLTDQSRLYIPSQASREFVRNRPYKLAELQQGLNDKASEFKAPNNPSYPILEDLPEYESLKKLLQEAEQVKGEIKSATKSLVDSIRNWEWNDPVSKVYRDVIAPSVIVECSGSREDLRKELIRRYDLKIPPGYKDRTKDDGGIGDFLIWKTIIEIGSKNKRPLIFVSGDEKSDWQYSASNVAFLPRVELVAEYRACSGGQMFYMVSLSGLLGLFGGDSSSVVELQQAEELVMQQAGERIDGAVVTVACPTCNANVRTQLGAALGSSATPLCVPCDTRFHVHRSRFEVIVRRKGAPHREAPGTDERDHEEIVFCPCCRGLVEHTLGSRAGASRWISCNDCLAKFPVRRLKDGSVWASSHFEAGEPPDRDLR